MKITIVCDVLGKENNGTTIAAMNLIRYLREHGHEVRVLCCDQDRIGKHKKRQGRDKRRRHCNKRRLTNRNDEAPPLPKKINHATHRLLVAFCDNLLYNKSKCCQQATKGGLYL